MLKTMLGAVLVVSAAGGLLRAASFSDPSPRVEERQLPDKMHSAMKAMPRIKVGYADADIVGADNRALQAAVDFVAGLGGGVVEIGPGDYLMRDSLHLRSHVTVRGTPGKTVLRKADAAASSLAIDGDFGEEQITVTDRRGIRNWRGRDDWEFQGARFPPHRGPPHRAQRQHLLDRSPAQRRLHGE